MSSRVAPFGYPRINGYLLLPEAFRSLSRPSSAPDAKAFPLRSFQLDPIAVLQRLVREFLVLFENYAGFTKDRNCMSPCILRMLSQSICFLCSLHRETSLLPYFAFCHIVQFSRCRSSSASFRLSPAQASKPLLQSDLKIPIFRSGLQIQRQIAWWARVGSNHRPYDYQSYALAS